MRMEEAPWHTIPELIEHSATTFGSAQALVDGEIQLSFIELKDEIFKSANALIETGVKPGDRIGIWAPNTWEWVCLLYTSPSPRDLSTSRMPSSA